MCRLAINSTSKEHFIGAEAEVGSSTPTGQQPTCLTDFLVASKRCLSLKQKDGLLLRTSSLKQSIFRVKVFETVDACLMRNRPPYLVERFQIATNTLPSIKSKQLFIGKLTWTYSCRSAAFVFLLDS
ncbi:unnamed protein product [Peronospora belbahrii]|uniref:Uncharacterized protein n=1 Tax=Peronospora belbahrii TaxID=622444 RepID=A0ABN8D4J6_9STRA|nr:unnamed protein product [Peronospora belbahrii]